MGIADFQVVQLSVMGANVMTQRPVLQVPQTPQTLVLDLVALAGMTALWAIALHAWSSLPERIPIHFGADGRPNSWGSKSWLWALPSLGTGYVLLFTVLRGFPHTFNYLVAITEENAAHQYAIACSLLNWLKAEAVWLFAYIEWQMVTGATNQSIGLGIWFLPLILSVIFGTIGIWLRASLVS